MTVPIIIWQAKYSQLAATYGEQAALDEFLYEIGCDQKPDVQPTGKRRWSWVKVRRVHSEWRAALPGVFYGNDRYKFDVAVLGPSREQALHHLFHRLLNPSSSPVAVRQPGDRLFLGWGPNRREITIIRDMPSP